MSRGVSRLLAPRRLAIFGGGAWGKAVVGAATRLGFRGELVFVHPDGKMLDGCRPARSIGEIGAPVDAAFIAVNRHATVEIVRDLAHSGAGGAVCFASGFREALAEDAGSADLQSALVDAAGDMPILGPNCYGFVNALDRVAIWPDQHGMSPVDRGVAILTQSSNIAINLTMQRRALPIGLVAACGNQAQTHQADLALALLDDPRITAIGLHVEGFGDLRKWEALAGRARDRGIPLVALKMGRSAQAQAATVSHTASLAGGDAGAQALLDRLGIMRLDDVPSFLETLKLLHLGGRLQGNRIAAISCSGGEASLVADMATVRDLEIPPLAAAQKADLRAALGPMVALANPLDYHTYIWRDAQAMTRAWTGMTGPGIDLTLSIVDYPHTDRADWECATKAALGVARTGARMMVAATMPELMPEDVAQDLMAGGVVPVGGLYEALAAVEAAARPLPDRADPVLLPGSAEADTTLTEAEAKAALAAHGLPVPRSVAGPASAIDSAGLTPPFAVKGAGLAHKSEHGAVRLGIGPEELASVAAEIGTPEILVEEMVTGAVAELLIGVTRDPAHGFVLTLGAGGTLTEILRDTVSLLVPSGREAVRVALGRLQCAPLLAGYRGKPAADLDAVLDAVEAVQSYVVANAASVSEVEVNPLICTPRGAVAADALIRKATQ
ncbi:acetate--CoA ligase family protein [Lutimaribacter marinistellae]|uniref:Acetate--CoA ligase family protein n=1 Tax=Lutimaribacter marinistellae TaxID=1820329 RepID=A0ABV7TBB7_9RHOB